LGARALTRFCAMESCWLQHIESAAIAKSSTGWPPDCRCRLRRGRVRPLGLDPLRQCNCRVDRATTVITNVRLPFGQACSTT